MNAFSSAYSWANFGDYNEVIGDFRKKGFHFDRFHKLRPSKGVLTGARKAPYPTIHRPYGVNTRQHVIGRRDTGVWDNTYYGKDLIGSSPGQAFIPPNASLGQRGAPAILDAVPALQSGPHHWLFKR